MQEDAATPNLATRTWQRVKGIQWTTWGQFGGLVLLVVGAIAWAPVNWSKAITWLGNVLASSGTFTLPGLVTLFGACVLVVVTLPTWISRTRRRQRTDDRPEVRPLRRWLVALAALGIAAVAAVAGWWLLALAAHAQDPAKARIDAVRTAMTFGAGLVGMVVLWLTGRKQWLAERSQRHTEADNAEQRVTELYTSAAEQLASDKAPVRLAGLYALSRLGQYNPTHRQTIINLWCAYLRMPFTPPGAEATPQETVEEDPAGENGSAPVQQPLLLDLAPTLAEAAGLSLDGAEQHQQERQVRLTAQRLLTQHLRPNWDERDQPTNPDFWDGHDGKGLDLDLAGATLDDWNFRGCSVRRANFARARFHNGAGFSQARFHGGAEFGKAWFHSGAEFSRARFQSGAGFSQARFHGGAEFRRARFRDIASFHGASFHGGAWFGQVWFYGGAWFDEVWARLDHNSFRETKPPDGWTVREADPGDGRPGSWGQFVSAEDSDTAEDEASLASAAEETADE